MYRLVCLVFVSQIMKPSIGSPTLSARLQDAGERRRLAREALCPARGRLPPGYHLRPQVCRLHLPRAGGVHQGQPTLIEGGELWKQQGPPWRTRRTFAPSLRSLPPSLSLSLPSVLITVMVMG